MNSLSPTTRLIASCFLLLVTVPSFADDWPQWRGPNRDGISKETGLLKQWPETGPKLLWESKDVGDGYSTPAVVGDRLYVMGSKGMDDEFVLRAERRRRQAGLDDAGRQGGAEHPGDELPRLALHADGGRRVALRPGLRRRPRVPRDRDRQVKWQKNLRTEFGGKPGDWAYSESVLVDGDAVVCTPGGGAGDDRRAEQEQRRSRSGSRAVPGRATRRPTRRSSPPTSAACGSTSSSSRRARRRRRQDRQVPLALRPHRQGQPRQHPHARRRRATSSTAPPPAAAGGSIRIKRDGDNFVPEQVYFDNKLPTAIGGSVAVGDHLYGTGGRS